MSTMEQRILEELVYDRVRSAVNLCQLVIVEQELDQNIQRAMARADAEDPEAGPEAGAGVGAGARAEAGAGGTAGPGPGCPAGALARAHVQRAWERLEREWSTLRDDLARAEGAGCAEGACGAS